MSSAAAPKRRISLPTGRYRLSQLFFNFYLLALGSFIVVGLVADFVISTALKGISDDYTRRFMSGTIVMIEEDLFRHPRAEWPKRLKAIDDRFAYKLALTERNRIAIAPTQEVKLDSGDMAFSPDGEIIYHRLKNTAHVLVVGPLNPSRTPDGESGLTLETRVRLLTWAVTGFILAIAVLFWVRPVWRDLEALRQTARSLGEGNFGARAPAAANVSFELLSETLNGMAERIQRLIATQRELSSAISHELRTPIARLRFALEMLADTDEREERERLWEMMETDLDELDNLIDSSLTYARFERETPELTLAETPIVPWLEEQVENVRVLCGKLDIALDTSHISPDLKAEFDRKALPFAVRNLLRNAIKYARTRILVSAEPAGDRILVHVDDDGIGIPLEEREHVFNAFTRLDRSRDRTTGGYGLGLAIARLVLELHGGSATAHDSPLGGARFTLEWPLKPPTPNHA